uniref:Uncharacterized protein n=1 Tax=Nymphaea colorata TaxID=210225 RepID=A0A5K0Y0Y5_9MAGN
MLETEVLGNDFLGESAFVFLVSHLIASPAVLFLYLNP